MDAFILFLTSLNILSNNLKYLGIVCIKVLNILKNYKVKQFFLMGVWGAWFDARTGAKILLDRAWLAAPMTTTARVPGLTVKNNPMFVSSVKYSIWQYFPFSKTVTLHCSWVNIQHLPVHFRIFLSTFLCIKIRKCKKKACFFCFRNIYWYSFFVLIENIEKESNKN